MDDEDESRFYFIGLKLGAGAGSSERSTIESYSRAEKRDIGEGFSGIGKANGL